MKASFLLIFFFVAIINKCSSQEFVTLDNTRINAGVTDNPGSSLISSGPCFCNTTNPLAAIVSTISRLPLLSTLTEFLSGALSSINSLLRSTVNGATGLVGQALSPLRVIYTTVSNVLDSLGKDISSILDPLGEDISSLLRSTVNGATSLVGQALSPLRVIYTTVSNVLNSLGEDISSLLNSTVNGATSLVGRALSSLPVVSNVLDSLGKDISSILGPLGEDISSLLRSTVNGATSLVGQALSPLLGGDEDSDTGVLRTVLSRSSENGSISLPQLLQSIDSAIESDANLTEPLGDLRAALTGGGCPASDIIGRAIFAAPGADSGLVRVSALRRSVDRSIASGDNETATVLEPLRAALDEDNFGQTLFRLWHFVQARVSNVQAFLLMLGPVGFAIDLLLSPIWSVVSSIGSVMVELIAAILSPVIDIVFGISSGLIKLIFGPISLIFDGVFSSLGFVGSILSKVIWTILSPFRSVINFVIGITWGLIKLIFAPISIIFNGVFSSLSFVGSILSNVIWAIFSPVRLILDLTVNIVSGAFRLVFAPISIVWNIVTALFRFLF